MTLQDAEARSGRRCPGSPAGAASSVCASSTLFLNLRLPSVLCFISSQSLGAGTDLPQESDQHVVWFRSLAFSPGRCRRKSHRARCWGLAPEMAELPARANRTGAAWAVGAGADAGPASQPLGLAVCAGLVLKRRILSSGQEGADRN